MVFKDSLDKYADIINLPHPDSKKHKRMSMRDRAAQFSPFAALTGHDAAIKETARLTDDFTDLDESMKRNLDEKLVLILEKLNDLIKEILQEWVSSNLADMFTDVNSQVESIAGEVSRTPATWNATMSSKVLEGSAL